VRGAGAAVGPLRRQQEHLHRPERRGRRQQVGRLAPQQRRQQFQRPAVRDDGAVLAGRQQSAMHRLHPRQQRRAGLAAGRRETERIGRPGIERGARHVIPRHTLPGAEIQFQQARIEANRRADRLRHHPAASRRAGPDARHAMRRQ